MKRPETFLVTPEYGPRPAGKPTECFYCQQPLGSEHGADCVIRQRTVVVRMTIEYVVAIPESWTPEDLEFHRNESSWCSSNALDEIGGTGDDSPCICPTTRFSFVREATPEDVALMDYATPSTETAK